MTPISISATTAAGAFHYQRRLGRRRRWATIMKPERPRSPRLAWTIEYNMYVGYFRRREH